MSSKSRNNRRPALPLSTLSPLDLDFSKHTNPWLVCVDCLRWVEVLGNLVATHKDQAGARCPGSAQLLDFDLTPAQHAARRVAALAAVQHPGERAAAQQAARRLAAAAGEPAPRARERIAAAAEPGTARTRARWAAARFEQARLDSKHRAAARHPGAEQDCAEGDLHMAAAIDIGWEHISSLSARAQTATPASRRQAWREFARGEFAQANSAKDHGVPAPRNLRDLLARARQVPLVDGRRDAHAIADALHLAHDTRCSRLAEHLAQSLTTEDREATARSHMVDPRRAAAAA